MNAGVYEYWIVNPMYRSVTVYSLNEERMYEQHDMKTERWKHYIENLTGLFFDLNEVF